MPIHPAFASRFHLLDAIPSIEAAPHGFLDLTAEVGPVDEVLDLLADTVCGGVPSAITTT